MEEQTDAFYVVRKGDIIGIYKSLSDCQAQVSSSVSDPSVSVYKGYSLLKEKEEFLACRGLKNALFTMNAVDVNDDLFGTLVPCPFREPDGHAFSSGKAIQKPASHKRSTEMINGLQPDGLDFSVDKAPHKVSGQKRSTEMVGIGSSSVPLEQSKKHFKAEHSTVGYPTHDRACILEFDGASKGNPGKAGAGAILRAEDGSVISRIRQGLGTVTNNVAEYRALILGMNYALKRGFTQIRVQGDSNLVVQQVNGVWQCKHPNMANLCKEAKELKNKFLSFKISHVLREFNSDADAEANLGVGLADGQIQEECGEVY